MFDTFKSRLEITGILTTITALHIGSGRSSEPIGSDLPVFKDILGRPLIPGSSFKGAMRSRLESFLRGIREELAVDPSQLVRSEYDQRVKRLKKEHSNDQALTAALIQETDWISRLFGAPWLAGKLQIRDLSVLPDAWFGQYQERDGVAIDRDTETASEGMLYNFQVVPANTPFQFHAVVENAEECELGLLMLGLHQFKTEQIPLGGGRSRGLGVVQLKLSSTRWFDSEGDPQRLLNYLQQTVSGSWGALSPEQADALQVDWMEALISALSRQIPPVAIAQTSS